MDRLRIPLLCVLCIAVGIVIGFWGLCWMLSQMLGGIYL